MKYAEIVILIRVKLNLTQDELAKILNVSFATVNRWENGWFNPSKVMVYKLKDLCAKNNLNIKF